QSALNNLNSSLKGNHLGGNSDDTEALKTEKQNITTRLYSEAASSDGSDGGGSFDVDDEVVDAEIVDER
ncbi:MAG: molecular chaperone DnaK, partial [Acidimicrobiales bacterium]|nr:molecular chaperone DnaK [Acidimicrobiales bacterium]